MERNFPLSLDDFLYCYQKYGKLGFWLVLALETAMWGVIGLVLTLFVSFMAGEKVLFPFGLVLAIGLLKALVVYLILTKKQPGT